MELLILILMLVAAGVVYGIIGIRNAMFPWMKKEKVRTVNHYYPWPEDPDMVKRVKHWEDAQKIGSPMICQKMGCRHTNPPRAEYCARCGSKL